MINVKSRKKREKTGLMLLEGKRLIQDALDANVKPVAIFFSRISDVKGLNLANCNAQLYYTTYKTLQFWSDLSTSQGVLGIFKVPDPSQYESKSSLPLTIVCDNVRDPGNMGAIIRTAAAVGCQQLLLTKGCADIWDSKVLRTGSGAHFRLCIRLNLSWDEVESLLSESCKLLLADSDVPVKEIDKDEGDLDVYELNDDGVKVLVNDEPTKRITAYQRKCEDKNSIPLVSYTGGKYDAAESLALVLGGETEGLSDLAYSVGKKRSGERVYVPLENGVESLNSGTAFGVIAYEIRRQISKMP